MMSDTQFWAIFNQAARMGRGDEDLSLDLLQASLDDLSQEDLAAYAVIFERVRDQLLGLKLWGALFLINGVITDEELLDFAAWVMLQGQEVYEKALVNPDCLAEFISADRDDYGMEIGEQIAYLPYAIHQEKFESELPFSTAQNIPQGAFDDEGDFDDPAVMSARYPLLWAKLGGFREGSTSILGFADDDVVLEDDEFDTDEEPEADTEATEEEPPIKGLN